MSDKKSRQVMKTLKSLDILQNQKESNKNNNVNQQMFQKQSQVEMNIKIEDGSSQLQQQKQIHLITMKNQLLSKFRNILDNIYSSNIQHNEQIERELNELSQILEMPMESLIIAMKNIQTLPNQNDQQQFPPFLRELETLNHKGQNYEQNQLISSSKDLNNRQQIVNNKNDAQQQYITQLQNKSISQKQQMMNMTSEAIQQNYQEQQIKANLNSSKNINNNNYISGRFQYDAVQSNIQQDSIQQIRQQDQFLSNIQQGENQYNQQDIIQQRYNAISSKNQKDVIPSRMQQDAISTRIQIDGVQRQNYNSANNIFLENDDQYISQELLNNKNAVNLANKQQSNNVSSSQDLLTKSNEIFSFSTQARKTNFFLQDLDFLQPNSQQQYHQNKQSQQQLDEQQNQQEQIKNKEQNEKNELSQQIKNQNNYSKINVQTQSPSSSLQRIKQMQLSPFSSKQQQQYQSSQSYVSQYQLKKDMLGKKNINNSARDEDIMNELNRIQYVKQQRESSAEDRQQNKQLRLLQILSKSSPERHQQFMQEKQKQSQVDQKNDRITRKDSDYSENNTSLQKKIINVHQTANISNSPDQIDIQDSPINFRINRNNDEQYISKNSIGSNTLIKGDYGSIRSPLNQSKFNNTFQIQSVKNTSEKPYFSSQQKTLLLIEAHQELDEMRKQIDDLNIDICNKDIEIIDMSTKLRDYQNQQLSLSYRLQQEGKQFEQNRQDLLKQKSYLSEQVQQYLLVLQDLSSNNEFFPLRSKKKKNSKISSEKYIQSILKMNGKHIKNETNSLESPHSQKGNKQTQKEDSASKKQIIGLPSSSTFSDSKANNNQSIIEEDQEDQMSEDLSINMNQNEDEDDGVVSNQVFEEQDAYFLQYISTQKLLASKLQSLQSNDVHKQRIYQQQQSLFNIQQENQRLVEQCKQMASILKGMNNMQEQDKDIDVYMYKLEQEKKSLEITLDELNKKATKKRIELQKSREQLNSQLNKIQSKKDDAAIQHNQIISKNQIQIQDLQKKRNQINQKLESELNQQRKELRQKISLNNFEKANLENDIKKKQDILDFYASKQQISIKTQVDKIQSELQILNQTNKFLKKDIENKRNQLDQYNNEDNFEEEGDNEENENYQKLKSEYAIEISRMKTQQKLLKNNLLKEKERLQLEKSFSNNKNEEFILQAEQKLNYHSGLKIQLQELNQEVEQLEQKKEEYQKALQKVELVVNNSKNDLNSHDQLLQQLKQLQESNQISVNKINSMNIILKEKKNILTKQEDELKSKLKPQLEQTIILISDLNMEEQDLIQRRKELKNLLK